jgi:hypothetical protein
MKYHTKTFNGVNADTKLLAFVKNIEHYYISAYAGKVESHDRMVEIRYI